jgi:hypothetical protein
VFMRLGLGSRVGIFFFDLSLHRFSSFLPLTRVDLGLG